MATLERMDGEIRAVVELSRRVRDLDDELQCEPAFISKTVLPGAGGGGGGGVGGGGDGGRAGMALAAEIGD